MYHPRFGDYLGRLVRLSNLDVQEILSEQMANRRRFGEIALAWGLCQPEHVWQAWCDQLTNQAPRINLSELGVDAQAIEELPAEAALRLGVIPIRVAENMLIVATPEGFGDEAKAEVQHLAGKQARFVIADSSQIQRALATYYPACQVAV